MKPIQQIYPWGPPVGKWTVEGTVAQTIKRALKAQQAEQEQRFNRIAKVRAIRP